MFVVEAAMPQAWIRPGQSARVRLDGFAWTSFGALPAVVERIAEEPDPSGVRVELGLRASPGLLAGLRVPFLPLHTSVLDHQGGAWQSVVMVGRKRRSN